jgi:predicted NBD/HSP70 family sugar kinase
MPVTAGVDLGGTKIQTVVVAHRRVVGQSRHLTPRTDAGDVMHEIVQSLREALDSAGATAGDLRAVGIGTPGTVDSSTGHVSRSANVPGFMPDVPLGPTVAAAFGGVPVTVDNDVRVAVVGEYRRGAGRPYKNVLGVFIGTGVGGGLILEGRLRHGRGSAGEIGHTLVVPDGRRCPCGQRGHLEAYAGRLSIEQTARRKMESGTKTRLFEIMEHKGRDRVSSSVIADALEQGDELTAKLVSQAVSALGVALSNVQNVLDLEAIIVGGGLGDRLGERFVREVDQAMLPRLRVPDHPPAVLATELGDLSGAVGAAVIAGG